MITIYSSKNWEWTRDSRARWVLNEVSVPFRQIELDALKGEHKGPENLARHPLGKIPSLEDGNTRIFESGPILLYLTEKYAPHLIPTEESERGLFYQWLFFVTSSIETPVVKIFANGYLFPKKEGATAVHQDGVAEFEPIGKYLDEKLAGKDFLVGNQFTAADIMLVSALVWANFANALEKYENLKKYFDRMSKRGSFVKTFDNSQKTHIGLAPK
jgi:glutathione S-transferase